MLADLRTAVDLGDWQGALMEALALWRKHRFSQLSAIIERLGERIPNRPGPHRQKGTHTWWCDLARRGDPLDVTRLVAHADTNRGAPANLQHVLRERGDLNLIVHALRAALAGTEPFFHARWGGWFERLVLVTDWPDEDPRWLPLIERWLAEPPVTQYIWPLRQTIEVSALCRKPLLALRDVLARSVAPPPAIAGELAAMIERLTPATTHDPAEEARLWAAVAAAPQDLAPRQVLGDYLISHGDPRGELFALQLALSRNAVFAQRLLSNHQKRWLHGIETLVMRTGTVWRGGMIEEARIGSIHTTDAAYELAPTHRELACVRTLVGAQISPSRYAALLGAMPQVERIGLYDPNVPAALAIVRPHWPYRIVELGSRDQSANRAFWSALDIDSIARLFPALETLVVLPRGRQWGFRPTLRAPMLRAREIFPRLQTIFAPREEIELDGIAAFYDGGLPQGVGILSTE